MERTNLTQLSKSEKKAVEVEVGQRSEKLPRCMPHAPQRIEGGCGAQEAAPKMRKPKKIGFEELGGAERC